MGWKVVSVDVQGQTTTLASGSVAQLQQWLDGQREAVLDLHSSNPEPSRPVWTSGKLSDAGHAVVLQSASGVFPMDCLTVSNHEGR